MFLVCGHRTKRSRSIQEEQSLLDFDYDEPDPFTRTPRDVASEVHIPDHHGKLRIVVAGDGACPNQGTKLACAGQEIFYGDQHSHNSLFRAENLCQSSDRAELRCLLRVRRCALIPVEYLTDNMAF